MRKSVAFLVMIMALALLSSCGQMEVQQPEEPHQEVIPDTESVSEATVVPVTTPEPEPPETEIISLPQPQADGTGISFEIPEDWKQYPTDTIQRLQAVVDSAGNRVLYGVLHGFMDSQEISEVSLVDCITEDYEFMVGHELSYDVSLDDGTLFRLSMGITGQCSQEDDEINFDNIGYADVHPQFANYYWSLDCEEDDWVYQVVDGKTTVYYSISTDFAVDNYSDYDDYDDSFVPDNAVPEEPTRLTQYNWPDYCDEMDCLMMESVGLQYNEGFGGFGTATKLLPSGALITISIVPQIGGGVEYGANVRVDGITTIPVKSSHGINYKCKSTGGKGGNMGGYSGLCITLTKDGWSNWY